MARQQPALVKLTSIREAFFKAYHQQKGTISEPLQRSVWNHLRSNSGRIFHKKGFFVTRNGR